MATKNKKQEDIQTLDTVDEAATKATDESKIENGEDTDKNTGADENIVTNESSDEGENPGESDDSKGGEGGTDVATGTEGTIVLDDDSGIRPLAADDYVENFEVGGKTLAVRDVEAQDSITQLNSEMETANNDMTYKVTSISTLTDTSQLTHRGFYKIANVDSSFCSSFSDYSVGDFDAILLSGNANDDGCQYGTLILTTPRTDNKVWVIRIWNYVTQTARCLQDTSGWTAITFTNGSSSYFSSISCTGYYNDLLKIGFIYAIFTVSSSLTTGGWYTVATMNVTSKMQQMQRASTVGSSVVSVDCMLDSNSIRAYVSSTSAGSQFRTLFTVPLS